MRTMHAGDLSHLPATAGVQQPVPTLPASRGLTTSETGERMDGGMASCCFAGCRWMQDSECGALSSSLVCCDCRKVVESFNQFSARNHKQTNKDNKGQQQATRAQQQPPHNDFTVTATAVMVASSSPLLTAAAASVLRGLLALTGLSTDSDTSTVCLIDHKPRRAFSPFTLASLI